MDTLYKSLSQEWYPIAQGTMETPTRMPYPVPVIDVSAQFLQVLVTGDVVLYIPCGSPQGRCHQEPVHNDVSVSPDGRGEVSVLLQGQPCQQREQT